MMLADVMTIIKNIDLEVGTKKTTDHVGLTEEDIVGPDLLVTKKDTKERETTTEKIEEIDLGTDRTRNQIIKRMSAAKKQRCQRQGQKTMNREH